MIVQNDYYADLATRVIIPFNATTNSYHAGISMPYQG
ncbi:CcdB family protein [Klebsiella pneumoniae subsp. pneumoniae]|nr:CcdB family protein [Klebsiella pneumoniae subsp. pneumoniae]